MFYGKLIVTDQSYVRENQRVKILQWQGITVVCNAFIIVCTEIPVSK